MAVLIEAISVVINRQAVEERFPGGMEAFQSSAPNRTLCADNHLVRVGFMLPADAEDFVNHLEAIGLNYLKGGQPIDMIVIDQVEGCMEECNWITLERQHVDDGSILTASLKDAEGSKSTLSVPGGWQYSNSLSKNFTVVPVAEIKNRLERVQTESGLITFRDRSTGETVYAASEHLQEREAEYEKIRAVVHRALTLDSLLNGPAAAAESESSENASKELVDELLPRVKNLALNSKFQTGFTHFAWGLVLRVLNRREEAVEQYRISLDYSPEYVICLLEMNRCLGELNRESEALMYAKKAVELEPDNSAALGTLAMTSIMLRDEKTACASLRKALLLAPHNEINLQINDQFQRAFGYHCESDAAQKHVSGLTVLFIALLLLVCGAVLIGICVSSIHR